MKKNREMNNIKTSNDTEKQYMFLRSLIEVDNYLRRFLVSCNASNLCSSDIQEDAVQLRSKLRQIRTCLHVEFPQEECRDSHSQSTMTNSTTTQIDNLLTEALSSLRSLRELCEQVSRGGKEVRRCSDYKNALGTEFLIESTMEVMAKVRKND